LLGWGVVRHRGLWRWLALAAGLSLACVVNTAIAQDRRVSFDIPRQVLADALYAYSSATGIEVLVSQQMIAQLRSAAILGMFTPEEALHSMLAGTGLAPRYTGANAFTLVPTASAAASEAFTTPRYSEYSAALQAALTSVLCRFRQTWPLDYRLAVRLWVAPSGTVQYVKFLNTTGDARRDAVLEALFRRVVVGEAPSSDLSQPTTVLILPRRDAAECLAMGVSVAR
jgi:hypothetical protein